MPAASSAAPRRAGFSMACQAGFWSRGGEGGVLYWLTRKLMVPALEGGDLVHDATGLRGNAL